MKFVLLIATLSFLMLNIFVVIGQIGKKREPITPGVANGVIWFNVILGAAIYYIYAN